MAFHHTRRYGVDRHAVAATRLFKERYEEKNKEKAISPTDFYHNHLSETEKDKVKMEVRRIEKELYVDKGKPRC